MVISEEKINEIRRSVNIVDVISDYIPIEQKGKNYFAVCPFHDDHNPSMSISPDKQIYTCFVCGAHGNVFTFIMDYENISFIEAVKVVANKTGIPLDISSFKPKLKDDKLENLYEIYDFANKFYQNNLFTKDGSEALSYLKNRGFDDSIIKEFEIGLSTSNKVTKLLKSKSYSDNQLVNSGISSSKGDISYDTFIDRIMFPLWDLEGKTVGFSGRIYNTTDTSKYVNSRESDIFKKGKMIYNYHKAKDEIRKKKFLILVEGFMDVIALYKVGIKNVVATMGTALTNDQANILKKLSTNIILCFDGDKAGEHATIAGSKELQNVGLNPSIIRLEEGLDPDEYIKKYGVEKFNYHIDNVMSLLDFKIDYYKSNTNFNNSDEVAKYIRSVVEELNNIDNKIIVELTISKLSDDTGISVNTIKGMINKKIIQIEKKEVKVILDKYDKAERSLLYYMLRHKEVIKMYDNNKCYFPTDEFRFLACEIVHYYNKHKEMNLADFISYISDKDELLDAIKKTNEVNIPETYSTETITEYIELLNEHSIKTQIKKLTDEFKSTVDINRKTEIAKEISELKVSE